MADYQALVDELPQNSSVFNSAVPIETEQRDKSFDREFSFEVSVTSDEQQVTAIVNHHLKLIGIAIHQKHDQPVNVLLNCAITRNKTLTSIVVNFKVDVYDLLYNLLSSKS